ncbi:MAG: hypothetical protein R6X33_16520 [Candidatus Brocadiia bacterium]
MAKLERIIHIVGASVATLISACFVMGYHSIQYRNHVVHGDIEIPRILHWIGAAAPWMFLVPPVVLIVGLLRLKQDSVVAAVTTSAWLFALGWALLCIGGWQMPFDIPFTSL